MTTTIYIYIYIIISALDIVDSLLVLCENVYRVQSHARCASAIIVID